MHRLQLMVVNREHFVFDNNDLVLKAGRVRKLPIELLLESPFFVELQDVCARHDHEEALRTRLGLLLDNLALHYDVLLFICSRVTLDF